ncbi:hypothetical protein [Chelatococcus composti]|uniref:Uncharacterized protein n=1 Tax=Chelatococcus composti TaxID=1743235 RepID=A0A841KJ95_9HYPH|nr:hypothetical protein [Chelatococcus composti]MBB6169463.1 hypothetical protein [Chelatococcus composti]
MLAHDRNGGLGKGVAPESAAQAFSRCLDALLAVVASLLHLRGPP